VLLSQKQPAGCGLLSRTAYAETFVETGELLLIPQLCSLNAAGTSPYCSENYVQNNLGGFLGTMAWNTKESVEKKKENKTTFF